jgi:PPP family 3-phenylpropionic acid transporter
MALFVALGIQLPYWPVWLAHRGMEPDQIGLLLGIPTWARLAAPWAGSWADRRGRAGHLATALAAASLACYAGFALVDGFVAMLLLSAVLGLALAPITPLVDGLALTAAAAGRLDYSRVRLWGSGAFVVASSVGGIALQESSPELILHVLLVASALLLAVTWWLPRASHDVLVAPAAPVPDLPALERPRLRTFLAAVAFMQGSHAVLYGFGTRHWQELGLAESTIGWLWSWGVIVEIALFAVGRHLVARFGALGLLLIAGAGGVVRWPLLAWVDSPWLLLAIQTLHAATFAAMHLGAMTWIRDSIPARGMQRATALYVATGSGVALGVGMPLAGVLYERIAGLAYLAMAGASLVGLGCALVLARAQSAQPPAGPAGASS